MLRWRRGREQVGRRDQEFSFQYVNYEMPVRQPGIWRYGARSPEGSLLRLGPTKEETGWVGRIYDLMDWWVLEAGVLKES